MGFIGTVIKSLNTQLARCPVIEIMTSDLSFWFDSQAQKGERSLTILFTLQRYLEMDKLETTHHVLSSLTLHETAVLRRRFGFGDTEDGKANSSFIPSPPASDDNGGSGGSAPASPLIE